MGDQCTISFIRDDGCGSFPCESNVDDKISSPKFGELFQRDVLRFECGLQKYAFSVASNSGSKIRSRWLLNCSRNWSKGIA